MGHLEPTEENNLTCRHGFSYFVDLNNELSAMDSKKQELLEYYNHGPALGLKLQISRSLAELIERRIHYTLRSQSFSERRKLVWEILDDALKRKIEINWNDIFAMRAVLQENKPGVLEIELSQRPMFYYEIDPQPRRHALWSKSADFTGGEASSFRRHYLEFSPGILDKYYEKLLQFDSRLLQLSQGEFPRFPSPFFDEDYNHYDNNMYYGVIKDLSDVPNDAVHGPNSCNIAIQQQTFPCIAAPLVPVPLTQQAPEQQFFGNAIALPSSHGFCVSTSPTSVTEICCPLGLSHIVSDQRQIQDQDSYQMMAFGNQGIDINFASLLAKDFMPINANKLELHTIQFNNRNLSNYVVSRPLITNTNPVEQYPASDFGESMGLAYAANHNDTQADHFFVTHLSAEIDALIQYRPTTSIANENQQQRQERHEVVEISTQDMPFDTESLR